MKATLVLFPAAVLSVVTFQGPLGAVEDSIECSSQKWSDDDFANLIAFGFDEFDYITQNGSSFNLQIAAACGSENALALEDLCYETDTDALVECNTALLPLNEPEGGEAAPQRRGAQKRGESYCDEYSGECQHRQDSGVFGCPSGFTQRSVEVPGHPIGLYCVKSCDERETDHCLRVACKTAERRCNYGSGSQDSCWDAISTCLPYFSVAMKQEFCSGPQHGRRTCSNCVSYQGGKCVVDRGAFDRFKAQQAQRIFRSSRYD